MKSKTQGGFLTMAKVMAIAASLPPKPKWSDFVLSPSVCWAFGDQETLAKYLNDELSELDLLELMRASRVQALQINGLHR